MSSSISCCSKSRQTKQDGESIHQARRYPRKLKRQLQQQSSISSSTVETGKFIMFRVAAAASISVILMVLKLQTSLSSSMVDAFVVTDVNLHRRSGLPPSSSPPSRSRRIFSHHQPSSRHLLHENDVGDDSTNHHHNDNSQRVNSHRRKFLISGTTIISSLLLQRVAPSYATVTDPKTGISQPEVGEIQDAVPNDWSKIDNPFLNEFDKSSFGRLDQKPDSIFYESPRFVEHIDENAVEIVTKYNTDVIVSTANTKSAAAAAAAASNSDTPPTVRVLDLCSSWTSHIDPNVVSVPQLNNDIVDNDKSKNKKKVMAQISGLGMNSEELKSNPLLLDWTIQDLNSNPDLSKIYPNDNTFDVVFCQLSIDYLTRPMEVLREVSRVLKVGGTVHIIFSNRLFLSKAVALWTGADDVDHTFYVSSYLNFCGGNFQNIEAQDLSTRRGSSSTKGGGKLIVGDPVFVVRAVKGGG